MPRFLSANDNPKLVRRLELTIVRDAVGRGTVSPGAFDVDDGGGLDPKRMCATSGFVPWILPRGFLPSC